MTADQKGPGAPASAAEAGIDASAEGLDTKPDLPEQDKRVLQSASALDALAEDSRWVAWRYEQRGKDGKRTKVPYAPGGGNAKSNDASTWGTRSEAKGRARLIDNGQGGGIGIQLGDIGTDLHLVGLDLDTCLKDGKLAGWASEILKVTNSYAEISPSGCGIKSLLYIASEDVRPFLNAIGVPADQWGSRRDVPGEDSRDHGPAIEVYCAGRYFAVTGNRWPTAPDKLRLIDGTMLEHLAKLIPQPVSGGRPPKSGIGGDTSRSAVAFRKGAALRRAGKTFEEMCEALRNDPETADWVREKGEVAGQRELRRIWAKAEPPDPDAAIVVRPGLRHQAADAGIAILDAVGAPFYQRDRSMVRVCMVAAKTADGQVTHTPGIVEVSYAQLGRALGQAARWERVDKNGHQVRIDPPRDVVEQIAEMTGEWPFPLLSGVIGTPTMRPDGSLLLSEGYDESTGLVLLGAPPMPPIPNEPTRHEAEAALALIEALLAEFPFRDGGGFDSVDRAVALSELLTPVLRGAMPAAPMHMANAPQPGTGKSYLADLASGIATGERCAVVAFSPKAEETEKRLNGSALAGHPIIALDNVSSTVEGDLLCQIRERPLLQLRPLGTSKMVRAANTFTVLANGNNNAIVAADMVRRTIECRLDANMESPETRIFRDDPLARIMGNRGIYIAACLTITRAFICAGMPGRLPTLASYGKWSDFVRSSLVWLGRADPVASMAALRSSDPERQARAAVFAAWAEELGIGGAHQTAELVKRANEHAPFSDDYLRPRLRDAFLDLARDPRGNLDPKRLGRWLAKAENNIAAGFKLTVDRGDASRPRWILLKA